MSTDIINVKRVAAHNYRNESNKGPESTVFVLKRGNSGRYAAASPSFPSASALAAASLAAFAAWRDRALASVSKTSSKAASHCALDTCAALKRRKGIFEGQFT